MEKILKDFLSSAKIPTTGNRLIDKFRDIGVKTLEDLKDLKESDLSDTGKSTYRGY